MKLSSKPISSPGRTEKYPPPLVGFLRSNAGSRSSRGGSSRSRQMFARKTNASIETQEPSSPKVTCMGQVRVKRSKQSGSKPGRPPLGAPSPPMTRCCSRCKWIGNALFCHHFSGKVKAKPIFRPSWKIWGTFFNIGSSRKPKIRKDSSKFGIKIEDSVEESEEHGKKAKIFESSSYQSPPKNALILTRSRSAPYRSSSLACRFWGLPLANQENKEGKTELENRRFKEQNPTSEKESICRNSNQRSQTDSETDENSGFSKEFEEKKLEKSEKNNEEFKTEQCENPQPLILTRCKSEPARTSERLDPEMNFWKIRRLGFT